MAASRGDGLGQFVFAGPVLTGCSDSQSRKTVQLILFRGRLRRWEAKPEGFRGCPLASSFPYKSIAPTGKKSALHLSRIWDGKSHYRSKNQVARRSFDSQTTTFERLTPKRNCGIRIAIASTASKLELPRLNGRSPLDVWLFLS